jgi:molybdate transport system ATP-binding protein
MTTAAATEQSSSSSESHLAISLTLGSFQLEIDTRWDAQVAVLFGPSGSGKSSVLETLLGLQPHARATLQLAGEVLEDSERNFRLPPEKRGLGWVPQESTLFPHLSVRQNLSFGKKRAGPQAASIFQQAVEVLEIGSLLDRNVETLSGGERQRVALARALASNPRALLLDEPLAALDRNLRARILPFLLRVRDEFGLPMLYITHDPDEAVMLGETLLVLDEGRVVANGPAREVLWSPAALPLAEALGLENVFEARVADEGSTSSTVRIKSGQTLTLGEPLPSGQPVTLAVRAEDILISTSPTETLSARNVLECKVSQCLAHRGHVHVHLDLNGETWVARLTPAAVSALDLQPGKTVYAIVKAQAIQRIS